MSLLLDTNALLWWLDDPARLGEPARRALEEPTNTVFCSAVSVVEIAIKLAAGRLDLSADWEAAALDAGFTFLPLTCGHARAMRDLPAIHKDPFDRMLVAQAITEKATLVTSDRLLERYGIRIIIA